MQMWPKLISLSITARSGPSAYGWSEIDNRATTQKPIGSVILIDLCTSKLRRHMEYGENYTV